MTTQLDLANFAAWRDANSDTAGGKSLPIVLDVREPWELQTASVTADGFTVLPIPMRELPGRTAELLELLGADHPIACLCHHGMRSLQVANYLTHSGFTEVVNLQGGIDAWSKHIDTSVPLY